MTKENELHMAHLLQRNLTTPDDFFSRKYQFKCSWELFLQRKHIIMNVMAYQSAGGLNVKGRNHIPTEEGGGLVCTILTPAGWLNILKAMQEVTQFSHG